MNWYKAKAKYEAKSKFCSIEEGEIINFRINEDQETITCRYTWQQVSFLKEEYLQFIVPLLPNNDLLTPVTGFLKCRDEVSQSLESSYQELLRESKKIEKQEKKKVEEETLLSTMDDNQKVDFEFQKKVTELVSNPLLKTKKDKIILLVKELGIKKKSEIQKYYPTDKSYLDEVFEKHIYGTIISFEEKRQLEIC